MTMAWHFVGEKLRDGRPVPADGVKLRHTGPVVICESGLHASLHPFDALKYAPGDTLCLVECGGIVAHQDDKFVCTERTIIARMDAVPLLRYFARQQALSVVHLWDAPQVVLEYLMGDDAARAAAWAATATRDAAGAAAWAAEWAAEWAAAEWAAKDVAAEWAAEWAAAEWAAKWVAKDEFSVLVNDAFEDWI